METEFDIIRIASPADAWFATGSPRWDCRIYNVASLADAWIETKRFDKDVLTVQVASLADAWIETATETQFTATSSRVPRGRVD